MKKSLLLALCISFMSWSCDVFNPTPCDFSGVKNFSLSEPSKIKLLLLTGSASGDQPVHINEFSMMFSIDGKDIDSEAYEMASLFFTSPALACSPYVRTFIEPLKDIQLISDQPFNSTHPAGTSLKDLLSIDSRFERNSQTIEAFIKGQEQTAFIKVNADGTASQSEEFKDNSGLNEYTLEFLASPQETLKHQFTLTFTFKSGKTLSEIFTQTLQGVRTDKKVLEVSS